MDIHVHYTISRYALESDSCKYICYKHIRSLLRCYFEINAVYVSVSVCHDVGQFDHCDQLIVNF